MQTFLWSCSIYVPNWGSKCQNIQKTVVELPLWDLFVHGSRPSQINQMNLINAIAAAVISGTFLIPTTSEARNVWIKGGCHSDGKCTCQKVISKNWPYVTYKNKTSEGIFTAVADCQKWRYKYTKLDGRTLYFQNWNDVISGSIGEEALKNVCRK